MFVLCNFIVFFTIIKHDQLRSIILIYLLLYAHLTLIIAIISSDQSLTDLIHTTLGPVIGIRHDTYDEYLGIPFAEPPLGRLRFRPPVPKRPWYPSIYHALDFSAECLQSELFTITDDTTRRRDENCLYLNIWQPNTISNHDQSVSLLPVLVWIYGGAFIHGGASKPEYMGDQLSQRDVIVVSFNYRVGALGFLVSTADGLYGNYGLDDQRMAMQWIHDNIHAFGGDPNRVTLFGESAGAMSIGLHLFDQHVQYERRLSRGNHGIRRKDDGIISSMDIHSDNRLFHRVILQSNPFGYKYRSLSVANFIGAAYKEQLDCEDLRCLQSESAEELIHVQDTLMAVPRSIGDFFTWGPVLTDQSYYREARLRPGPISNVTVRQPIHAIHTLKRLDIPIIMGTTTHEGQVFVFTAWPTRMAKIIYQALVFSLFRSSAPKVLKVYRGYARQVSQSPYPDYRSVLSQIIGDYLFRCPNQYMAAKLSKLGIPVYLYEFALATKVPGFSCCDGLACHTCELPYVFHQLDVIWRDYSWNQGSSIDSSSTSLFDGATDEDSISSLLSEDEQSLPVSTDGGFNVQEVLGALGYWLSQKANNLTGGKSKSNISQVDAQVSRLMMDFWTTFARYGDPNGLLSLHSNGYRQGTRPQDAPWWPRLFGELPELDAVREMQRQSFSRTNNLPLSDEYDGVDYSYYGADKSEWTDGPENDIDQYKLWINEDDGSSTDDNIRTSLNPWDSWLYSFNQENMKNSDPISPTGIRQARSMHQMTFDSSSGTTIIENDCICNFWNSLDYRF